MRALSRLSSSCTTRSMGSKCAVLKASASCSLSANAISSGCHNPFNGNGGLGDRNLTTVPCFSCQSEQVSENLTFGRSDHPQRRHISHSYKSDLTFKPAHRRGGIGGLHLSCSWNPITRRQVKRPRTVGLARGTIRAHGAAAAADGAAVHGARFNGPTEWIDSRSPPKHLATATEARPQGEVGRVLNPSRVAGTAAHCDVRPVLAHYRTPTHSSHSSPVPCILPGQSGSPCTIPATAALRAQ